LASKLGSQVPHLPQREKQVLALRRSKVQPMHMQVCHVNNYIVHLVVDLALEQEISAAINLQRRHDVFMSANCTHWPSV